METFYISWEAPEFVHRPKTMLWYWGSIVIAVLILAMSIWQKNFLFGVFIVIAELLILIWGGKEPQNVKFVLTEKGLNIGEDKFYSLADFKSFSVEKESEITVHWLDLVFNFKTLKPPLMIKAPRGDALSVRQALIGRLPEIEWDPSFLDEMERFLGF